jgi:hypothetical protein
MKNLCTLAALALAACSQAIVFPTAPHANYNFIPFGGGLQGSIPTMHQVFLASIFSAQTGGSPARIDSIGFAPGVGGGISLGQVTINLGYTNAIPGMAGAAGGLVIPTQGGGGNNNGPMTTFYSNPNTFFAVTSPGTENFSEVVFVGTPFIYDPGLGNLLVEIIVPDPSNTSFLVSRSDATPEASRAFSGTRFGDGESPTTATRMDFNFAPVPEPGTFIAVGAGLALLAARRFRK